MPKNKPRNRTLPLLMILLGAALILGGGGWYLASLGGEAEPASVQSPPAEENYPQVERVSLEEAKVAYEDGSALFVDVRADTSYAQSHIPAALSIPLAEIGERAGELDPAGWIITY